MNSFPLIILMDVAAIHTPRQLALFCSHSMANIPSKVAKSALEACICAFSYLSKATLLSPVMYMHTCHGQTQSFVSNDA